jgi:ribbon-helix-helix CopG family protein
MIRTQIQLDEAKAEALKRKATERGVSMAALIREAVDTLLAQDDREAIRRRALSVAGKFHSEGPTDVSEEHDRYLAEDFLA